MSKNPPVGVPSPAQRLDILNTLLTDLEHLLSESHIQHLAMSTHGFVGADLAALCNEAALVCLRRYSKSSGTTSNEGNSDIIVGESDSSHRFIKNSRNSSDIASSSVSGEVVPISERLPSGDIAGTVSETADNSQNGGGSIYGGFFVAEEDNSLNVTFEDFEKARLKVRPSAMREV